MNKRLIILILICLPILFSGCKKNNEPVYTGIVTIDNTIYPTGNNYYAVGFSFELGKKIKTTEEPGADLVVLAAPSGMAIDSVYLDTSNLTESFALAGEFTTSQEAKDFYNSLTRVESYNWTLVAGDIADNQVWIFKTREGHYVKIRLIDVIGEMQGSVPYAEVEFQWRIQPDGSATFPEE